MADGEVIDIISFETGGIEMIQINGTTGASVVSSPAPASDKETYLCLVENDDLSNPNFIEGTLNHAIGTDWLTMGIKVRFPYLDADPAFKFAAMDDDDTEVWSLETSSDTDLILTEHSSTIATLTDFLVEDTEYNIEVKWKDSITSPIRVWVNGVLEIDLASEDIRHTGNGNARMQLHDGAGTFWAMDVYFGTCYLKRDDGDNIYTNETVLGDWTSFGGAWGHDTTITGAGANDALSSGLWTNTDNTPGNESTFARYTSSGFGDKNLIGGYSVLGPTDGASGSDADLDNELVGAAWVWRFKTYGQNKFGQWRPDFVPWYGSHATETSNGMVQGTDQGNASSTRGFVVVQDKTGSEFPADTDYMQVGFELNKDVADHVDGSVDLLEAWCLVLHKEAVATGTVGPLVNPATIRRGLVNGGGLIG